MTRYGIFLKRIALWAALWAVLAILPLAYLLAYYPALAQETGAPETLEAPESFGIAVVVNNAVVTHRDVENRMRLLFLEGGLPANPENIERLRRLSRFQLIDEALQSQQVRALGIGGDRTAVKAFIGELERNNNLPPGGLRDLLTSNNIEFAHFERQQMLRSAWRFFLQQRFEATGGVNDDEINDYIERVKARQGDQEVRLREIFLPYPSPLLVAKTNALGQEILQRLAAGAEFATLAGSFSASHSARSGGDSGWVPVNFLADHLKQAVRNLQPGEVSGLIETLAGIIIVKLEGKRSLDGAEIANATNPAQVRNLLRGQKLELLHRQTLHRLKNDAFIELR